VTGGGAPTGSSDDDAPKAGEASVDGALEPDERRWRTLGPVATAVTQGAVGFGSTSGGPEGARWWQILEERMRRRIPEARAMSAP
jgi:hypothetical protein